MLWSLPPTHEKEKKKKIPFPIVTAEMSGGEEGLLGGGGGGLPKQAVWLQTGDQWKNRTE